MWPDWVEVVSFISTQSLIIFLTHWSFRFVCEGDGTEEGGKPGTRVRPLDLDLSSAPTSEDRLLDGGLNSVQQLRASCSGNAAIAPLLHNTGALTKIHTPRHLSAFNTFSHRRLGGAQVGPAELLVALGLHKTWNAPKGPFFFLQKTQTEFTRKTTAREWEHHIDSKLPHSQDGTFLKLCNVPMVWDSNSPPEGRQEIKKCFRDKSLSGSLIGLVTGWCFQKTHTHTDGWEKSRFGTFFRCVTQLLVRADMRGFVDVVQ